MRTCRDIRFAPFSAALKQIQILLESDFPPPVMLAMPTLEEFKDQKLPAHCKAIKRKIHGPRVPVRGRRRINESPSEVANWPKDGMVEGNSPMLTIVIGGEADIRLADYVVHCKTGDVIYIPEFLPKLDGSRPHYEQMTPDAKCDLLKLHATPVEPKRVSGSICHSRGDQHISSSKEEACWSANVLLFELLIGLGEELQSRGQTKSTFHVLAALVALLMEEIESGRAFESLKFPSDSLVSVHQNPVQHAVQYAKNHLDKPLTINQVSRWVGLSRSVFTAQFRDETGESFKAYVNRLRLEQAKVLLCETNLSIDRVSENVGMASGQLRQLFHQKCQCSPREFREMQKKSQKQ